MVRLNSVDGDDVCAGECAQRDRDGVPAVDIIHAPLPNAETT
jgi:hypothetical protein